MALSTSSNFRGLGTTDSAGAIRMNSLMFSDPDSDDTFTPSDDILIFVGASMALFP
jgi:hypothetical protein